MVQYLDYCLIVFYRHETVETLHYKFNAFLVEKWTPYTLIKRKNTHPNVYKLNKTPFILQNMFTDV